MLIEKEIGYHFDINKIEKMVQKLKRIYSKVPISNEIVILLQKFDNFQKKFGKNSSFPRPVAMLPDFILKDLSEDGSVFNILSIIFFHKKLRDIDFDFSDNIKEQENIKILRLIHKELRVILLPMCFQKNNIFFQKKGFLKTQTIFFSKSIPIKDYEIFINYTEYFSMQLTSEIEKSSHIVLPLNPQTIKKKPIIHIEENTHLQKRKVK